MSVATHKFAFDVAEIGLDGARDFVARISAGLKTRAQLFGALRRALILPDYFGNNWDALSDCLRDLSWIKSRRVILLHEDLPQLGKDSLGAYLDVLFDAIHDWKPGEDHELIVVFPPEYQNAVAGALEKTA